MNEQQEPCETAFQCGQHQRPQHVHGQGREQHTDIFGTDVPEGPNLTLANLTLRDECTLLIINGNSQAPSLLAYALVSTS